MSLRRDRGKPAFPPDPHNLGGVQTLIDEYRHMQERKNTLRPLTTEIAAHRHYPEGMSMAERLSHNRAARLAATDTTATDHINRIYHMHRRIEENYSRSARIKDPWDTTVHPVFLRRDTNAYLEMLEAEMEARRPSSAPAWARDRHRRLRVPGDSYSGWSVRESLHAAYPKSRYAESLQLADRAAYKRAMMAEILDNRMYREEDLKKLFKAYIRLAPLGDKDTVTRVVAELKRELLVE